MRRAAGAWLALAVIPALAAAQFGYFGENKIQYRRFDWRVLHGPHVDLYYYPEEDELGRVALAYAEESYRVLEGRFNAVVKHRIPLVIYASHGHFEQTNILPFLPPENLLGVTEFLKGRVALPFTGSYNDFRHTLRHELVHVFQLALEADAVRRYPRLHHAGTPLWYSEGLAEFFSAGEDTRDEMILRDLTVSGQLPALRDLSYAGGGIIYPIGGIIQRFLAQTYGEWRIPELYREIWKYPTFNELMAAVYGRSLDQLSDEWQFWMRRRYYPVVTTTRPLGITARLLTRYAIKPAAFASSTDSEGGLLFFSPASGYTDITAMDLDGGHTRVVVKGERTPEFESFHYFESRLDVNPDGVVAFGSRFAGRDALFLWSVPRHRVVGRYQFAEIESVLSPAWAPDGRSVVFSGLSVSGYSDLYRVWLDDGRLERLTRDRYQDLDPSFSPDGRSVVFSSDRTPFGSHGARNLFRLDLASGAISYLTYGDWQDDGPRWSAATGRIYFASDRTGISQIYSIDSLGSGRRETNTDNGAFDPQYVDRAGGFVFGGFADLSFNLYFAKAAAADDTTATPVTLAAERVAPEWTWPELGQTSVATTAPSPVRTKFTFDFAAGDAIVAPGIGSAQGLVFLFSDQLGDHAGYVGLSSFQGSGLGNLLDNINGTVFYLNQAHRINWGVGAFRLRGLFLESDFTTEYDETSSGMLAQLRYPLSRFRRIEAEYRLEHSDRLDLTTVDPTSSNTDLHRIGWLASNYLSYIKDNTLWLATGPIDGERYNFTAGLVSDLSNGRFDSWLTSADYRRYLRTSRYTAFAVRGIGYYTGGERPRPVNIGGSWGIRGYPYYGYVGGSRAWMLNGEWRFPITDFLSIGAPFGVIRFPGVQGAVFVDYGRAWTRGTTDRGALGSSGFSFRMPIGVPLVLRLDVGWRFHSGNIDGYSLPLNSRGRHFVDFFFGFNY